MAPLWFQTWKAVADGTDTGERELGERATEAEGRRLRRARAGMERFLVKRPRGEEGKDGSGEGKAARSQPPTAGAAASASTSKLQAPHEAAPEAAELLASLHDESWRAALGDEVGKEYFASLARAVAKDRAKKRVYPPANEVFTTFNLTPLPDVRVVILGQDPYHGPGQAHGLSFSVGRGVAVPPSLKNIYNELESDLAGEFRRPTHGHLASWARRGVLMLNATLTVRAGEANSHEKLGWQTFTDKVIKILNARADPIVFILWGGFARKKAAIVNRSRHCVIETAHPSPLSVTKFRGCKCFSKANEYLRSRDQEPLDWSVDE